jgi:DNA processing protein
MTETTSPTACAECLRRAWLLAQLAPYIERVAAATHPAARLRHLLRLPDRELAIAVAPESGERILEQVGALPERRLRADLDAAECWAVCRHDSLYPLGLRDLGNHAPALIGRGDPRRLRSPATPAEVAALVGARRASSYGREVARTLGRDLAAAGLTVVSGMAFGIDACVHRGALDAGTTVAVLGCGPDVAYPAAHRSLWRRISENGLVLSALPPGTGAWRWAFAARNRIIAALAGITVVVEAAEHSGSLATSETASDLGRSVGAVPGPVGSRVSAGPNRLLAEGASVVRDAADVLAVLPPRAAPAAQPDPNLLRFDAEALIGEDKVPSEVLRELLATYGDREQG